MPVPAPVAWMGLGPALQKAALLDGAFSSVSELVLQNSESHSRALLFPVFTVTKTILCLKSQAFEFQNPLQGHKSQRSHVEREFYFPDSASEPTLAKTQALAADKIRLIWHSAELESHPLQPGKGNPQSQGKWQQEHRRSSPCVLKRENVKNEDWN